MSWTRSGKWTTELFKFCGLGQGNRFIEFYGLSQRNGFFRFRGLGQGNRFIEFHGLNQQKGV